MQILHSNNSELFQKPSITSLFLFLPVFFFAAKTQQYFRFVANRLTVFSTSEMVVKKKENSISQETIRSFLTDRTEPSIALYNVRNVSLNSIIEQSLFNYLEFNFEDTLELNKSHILFCFLKLKIFWWVSLIYQILIDKKTFGWKLFFWTKGVIENNPYLYSFN